MDLDESLVKKNSAEKARIFILINLVEYDVRLGPACCGRDYFGYGCDLRWNGNHIAKAHLIPASGNSQMW